MISRMAGGIVMAVTVASAALSTLAARGVTSDPAHVKEVEEWRAKHEADYRRDWVSIDGLFFLAPGENRAGSGRANDIVLPSSVPESLGSFFVENGSVRFVPGGAVAVSRRAEHAEQEEPVTAAIALNPDGGKEPADELIVQGVRMVVHPSGERLALRLRDERGEMARSFLGFRWFPIDGRYRVTGHLIRDPAPHEVKIPNLIGDIDTYTTEGVVEFVLNGETMRMRPMTTRPNRFYFIFKDASSGHETYAAARFLYSDLREDGTTVLDFNEAYNPPCAFNPYTTCPIPPRENRLKARILAGERAYPQHPVKRSL
jgi:uncharacterized protein (DUF1684 family)